MPPLTREQLAYRRSVTTRQRRQRQRRLLIGLGAPVLAAVLLIVMFALLGARGGETGRPLAAPLSSTPLSSARPPDLTIARGEGVSVNLPVDPAVVTAAAFHPIGDPTAVAMEPTGAIPIEQVERDGRQGPGTAGLDIGAPVGTSVYAPVDGVVVSVADYKINGRIEGFEISIAPDVASRGVVVRMTHLDDPERGGRLRVGQGVQAGETLVGRVRDFTAVGRQELAQFTSDAGNHVHIELIRTQADLFL
ncbi:MAG: M23 family metallopeptidase [Miltoncostaeaceae bacterium]